MLIIDAQVHIWGKGLPTNPSHRQITSFTADDLLKEMDEGGIDAAVIHPPGWDSDSRTLAVEAAAQHPNRLAILGNFHPGTNPKAAARSLDGSSSQECLACASPSSNHTSRPG